MCFTEYLFDCAMSSYRADFKTRRCFRGSGPVAGTGALIVTLIVNDLTGIFSPSHQVVRWTSPTQVIHDPSPSVSVLHNVSKIE